MKKQIFFSLIVAGLTIMVFGYLWNQERQRTLMQNQPTNIGDAIKNMEQKGELPILDRTDTLLGIDANKDGVRDDIEKEINGFFDSDVQKKALRQFAKSMNQTLESTSSSDEGVGAALAFRAQADGLQCMRFVYGEAHDLMNKRADHIEAITINTMPRVKAYDSFLQAIDGVSDQVKFGGETCK